MKRSELFTHPGEAIQAWRDQLKTLCKECPQVCRFVCSNNHSECQDKCFQAWLSMDVKPHPEKLKPVYHILYGSDGQYSTAKSLTEARKLRSIIYKKYPDLIIDISGPWYPFKADGIEGYCVCSSRSGANKMNKAYKERMKS